ncbi:MAG TPA: head-tail adaptor protein [Hymenobacter sp.]|jgi:head-tail adaptor
MLLDAGELTDRVTVLAAIGQQRDELSALIDSQKPLYTAWAKVQDVTGADATVAGSKPEQQTYRVLMRVHPNFPASVYSALQWEKRKLQVVSYKISGMRRDCLELMCSHTDGV